MSTDTVGTLRDTCKTCKRLYLTICAPGPDGVTSVYAHEVEAQAVAAYPASEAH